MAEKYSFFNAEQSASGEFDRTYLAEDIAAYFASFVDDGVFANPASNLQVWAFDGMTVVVKAGKGWIKGYYYELDSDLSFKLNNADGIKGRIDSVVMRLDLVNRYIRVFVKEGALSAKPVAPALTRNADVWELQLATIKVKAGAIKINGSDITDTRMNDELCGFVKGVIEQIDTSALFKQYDDAFNSWFEKVKNQLSEDAAGKLQIQVNDIQEQANKASAASFVFFANFYADKWSATGDGGYLQTAYCAGMKGDYNTDAPWVRKSGNREADDKLKDALNDLSWGYITTGIDSITAKIYSAPPTIDIPAYFRRADLVANIVNGDEVKY